MATRKKPIKRAPGEIPEPENPRAEPGSFVIRGKAWFDEYGEEVINEDGNIPDFIECELEQYEEFLYDEGDFRNDGKPRAKAIGCLSNCGYSPFNPFVFFLPQSPACL